MQHMVHINKAIGEDARPNRHVSTLEKRHSLTNYSQKSFTQRTRSPCTRPQVCPRRTCSVCSQVHTQSRRSTFPLVHTLRRRSMRQLDLEISVTRYMLETCKLKECLIKRRRTKRKQSTGVCDRERTACDLSLCQCMLTLYQSRTLQCTCPQAHAQEALHAGTWSAPLRSPHPHASSNTHKGMPLYSSSSTCSERESLRSSSDDERIQDALPVHFTYVDYEADNFLNADFKKRPLHACSNIAVEVRNQGAPHQHFPKYNLEARGIRATVQASAHSRESYKKIWKIS